MEFGNPLFNIAIFLAFVVITLVVVIRVSKQNVTAGDFYHGGRAFSGRQNGIAIAGDYLSAASFLGIVGAVALYGYDGLLYSVGFLVAWLVALLLVAEPLRNTAKYTMADVLSFRMRQRPVRTAAATSTLAVTFFYLLAQMAGAGALVSLLIGIEGRVGQSIVIAVVGVVMIAYVLIGGMKGTTWVQIIKAVLLVTAVGVSTVWILALNGFNLSEVLGKAVAEHPDGATILEPMHQYGTSGASKLGFVSLAIALVFGAAGLPHVLMRFYTVPTAKEARRSVVWAIGLIGFFYLCTMVLGFAAAYMVGVDVIGTLPGGSNSAAPALAYALGGTVLMGIISAVAFATILAVVAGLTITASASFAHDIYNGVIKEGSATSAQEVRVARRTAVVIGGVSIIGGILAAEQNVAFLVSLAFAIAASANLPSILYSLYWKRFNTRGSLWSIYGGLGSALILITFSPVVSGSETAMIPGADFAWFPLTNPAIISVPLGFFLGWLGSVTSSETNELKQAEMEVRSMTGAGAEKATQAH
ncbi:solute symporter family protein [Brachybacterium paraconglomeratum]|uniref:solute symporter family protein n=1 Tax=Brachybacterium paraconglomeratum TaxID=173362 RepID=UPI0038238A7D